VKTYLTTNLRIHIGYFSGRRRLFKPQFLMSTIGLSLGLGLLTGCGASTEYLDKLQAEIQTSVTDQGGSSLKSVICSQTEANQSLQCVGVLESGSGFDIEVKKKDDQSFDWKIPSVKGLLNMNQLQTAIQEDLKKELKGDVTIDCGIAQTYRATKPGESFECQAKVNPGNPPDQKSDSKESKQEAAAQAQSNQKLPSPSSKNQPEKIMVTMLPTGDVSWQRLSPVQAKAPTDAGKASSDNSSQPKPGQSPQQTSDKSLDKAASSSPDSTPDKASDKAPGNAPDNAKSAEDFLNQAGATDDF
jgi:hypothetical protein